jgi:hypothetical protein
MHFGDTSTSQKPAAEEARLSSENQLRSYGNNKAFILTEVRQPLDEENPQQS